MPEFFRDPASPIINRRRQAQRSLENPRAFQTKQVDAS
jgi:hypothetical protein